MTDNDWTTEDLELEQAMLTLEPGTYVELHGAVVVCSQDGVRAVMSPEAFKAIRERPKGTTATKE